MTCNGSISIGKFHLCIYVVMNPQLHNFIEALSIAISSSNQGMVLQTNF